MSPSPARIGNYELRGPLGRGATATVFRAWDPALRREVALKLFPAGAGNSRQTKRLAREAEALARLRHPNIVRVHSVGDHQGRPYLVMDLVAGRSLAEVLADEGPLAPERAVDLTLQVASALEAAHAQHVLHRDLKPENILLRDDGVALLTDFGLAKDLAAPSTSLSQAGQFLGTPGYWPPEQARGDVEAIGPRADVYGLGATLYALLTGRPPFDPTTLVQVLTATLHEEPVPPHRIDPTIPRWLSAVCLRCLRKAPAQRYPDAKALAEALRHPARRSPLPWVTAALLLAVCGGGLAAAAARGAIRPAAATSPASPPAEADPDPSLLARRRCLEHVFAGRLPEAEANLQQLGGTSLLAPLSATVMLERRRQTAQRSAEVDESQLLMLDQSVRDGWLREARALLDECGRLDPQALGASHGPMVGRVLGTVADLLFMVWTDSTRVALSEADESRIRDVSAQATGTVGAAKLGLALTLQSDSHRATWASSQTPETNPLPTLEMNVMRAQLLAREWCEVRAEDAIRVGEAALGELDAEPAGMRLALLLRALRQDLTLSHVQVGLRLLRERERERGWEHVERAYQLGYKSLTPIPLDAPPLLEADAALPRPIRGAGGFNRKTLANVLVALLVARQFEAALRIYSLREDPTRETLLKAELALIRGHPNEALAALTPACDAFQEAWGIRAHALRLLGKPAESNAVHARLQAQGRTEIGLPWHCRGPWLSSLVAGDDAWWPGAD